MCKQTAGSIAIFIACWTSIPAIASDACEASPECIKAVSLIGPLDAMLKRCAVFDPQKADTYRQVVSGLKPQLEPEFLATVRASKRYIKIAYETNARLDKQATDNLQETCDRLLGPKQ